jgi:membrane protein involved in colicin uptake
VRIAVSLALQRHGGADLERYARSAGGDKAAAATAKDSKPADKSAAAAAAAKAAKAAPEVAAAAVQAATAEQAAELEQYVRQLQAAFLAAAGGGSGSGTEVAAAADGGAGDGTQQRQWAVEQLCGVLKQAAAPAEVKHSVLRFLAQHALFTINVSAAKKVRRLPCCAVVCCAV